MQAGAIFLTVLFSLPTVTPAQETAGPTPDVDGLLERAEAVYEALQSMTADFEQTAGRLRHLVPEGTRPLQDGFRGP